MNSIYKKLEKLISTLQDSGKIRLKKSDFRFYSESIPESLKNDINNFRVAPTILAYYQQIDFVDILWFVSDENSIKYLDRNLDAVEGSLNISNFLTFVDYLKERSTQETIDPYRNLSEPDYASLANYIPFDILNGNGAVCLKNEDGEVKDELHLVFLGDESFIQPLSTDIETYLDKGFENYFFNEWQLAVFLNNEESRKQMEFYLKQLIS